MIRGSCLCGGVKFEITRATGPFELCHCSRCRKANGPPSSPGWEYDAKIFDSCRVANLSRLMVP